MDDLFFCSSSCLFPVDTVTPEEAAALGRQGEGEEGFLPEEDIGKQDEGMHINHLQWNLLLSLLFCRYETM